MSNEATATATTPTNTSNAEVRIWIEKDEDASRISAVLEALGYKVLRELEEGDGPSRLRWAINRLARRHKLTPREQDILERVLAGRNNEEIAMDLEISRATVKWHMHNVFAKTSTGNREALLRLALQLGVGRPPQKSKDDDEAEADDAAKAKADDEAEDEAGEHDAPKTPQAELETEPHTGAQVPASSNAGVARPAASVPSKSWF